MATGDTQAATETTTGATGAPSGATTAPTTTSTTDAKPAASVIGAAATAATKTDAQPGTEQKPAADAVKPLDLKIPEGLDAKDPAVASAVSQLQELAKTAKFSPEQAQAAADAYFKAQEPLRKLDAQIAAEQKAWVDEIKADKEIGGANFEASAALASRAVAKFGGQEAAKLLEERGLGNHPALVKLFVRIGKSLAEDSIAGTQGGAAAGKPTEFDPRDMYPNTKFPS